MDHMEDVKAKLVGVWKLKATRHNVPDNNGTYIVIQRRRGKDQRKKLSVVHYNGKWASKSYHLAVLKDSDSFDMDWKKYTDPFVNFRLWENNWLKETTLPV